MPLLNYTTKVPAEQSASEIVGVLATHRATAILLNYEAGKVVGISFKIATAHGEQSYTMPVRAAAVEKVLLRQYAAKAITASLATKAQAERVAWRIVLEWVKAQMALIETEMVALEQVFLPYMNVGGGTLYDRFLAMGTDHLLPAGKSL